MADIFTRTNVEREEEAMGGKPRVAPPPPKPAAKPAVDFFRQPPKDPEAEAAKAEALKRLLRDR